MADTTVNYTSNLPPWHANAWEQLYNRGNELSQQPYTPFEQPRIAGFSADQTNAMDMVRNNVGIGTPTLDSAITTAQGAVQAPTQAGIQQFMNPYDNLVTNSILDELVRRNQVAAQGDAATAVRAGAFGGDRFGLVESERNRNLNQVMGDVLSQRGAANFAQALDQVNKQQAIGLQGAGLLSNLAGNQQSMATNDATTLMGIGTLQQGQEQQNLDLNFADFQAQQKFPYDNIKFLSDLLRGTPSAQSQTTSTQPEQSSAAQWVGLGLAGIGTLGKAFKWF